ncbi:MULTISPECIES: pirin-like C-terminal cupin domain-containing protein [Kitasatospora]|uniref:Pirin C-terminal domain-containing protein n=1 Tax=Kitasatospora setae (strain ATCC 33774 / DSM 43861 / JCM 3304 / KCC A-0304 / NBRC 14216 / KM-6054) TaxID=452652 RepID=E4N6L0_KITSK|nr:MULTISPECIES: pirin-like C-terminal cupin domain-containing protein [Kitasatospora]BAJ26841.1 hypothetical protein KSE_10060 [Kitasatospora setae KM-6054]
MGHAHRDRRPAPAHHNAAAHVLTGRATAGGSTLPDGRLAVLGTGRERFTVRADGGPAEALVLVLAPAGEPIGEPVARGGPFVMNTAAELRQAQQDFTRGATGRMPF